MELKRADCAAVVLGTLPFGAGCWVLGEKGAVLTARACCGGQQVMAMLAFGGYEVFREGRERWEIDAERRDRGNFQRGKWNAVGRCGCM